VARVVDHPAVDLLRDAIVEAAVARLHGVDGNAAALGHVRRERAVGVAQHEQPVGRVEVEDGVDGGEDRSDPLGEPASGHAQVTVRLADAELLEEDVAEHRIEVLPGVDQHDVRPPIEALEDAAQPDDLRPRPEDDEDLHRAGWAWVSGIIRWRRRSSATVAGSATSSAELYSRRSKGSPSGSAGRSSGRVGRIARYSPRR